MYKFIPVFIFVMPLVVSAADWGTSQKGVVRNHSAETVTQENGYGIWKDNKTSVFSVIDRVPNKYGTIDNAQIVVRYGKYGPTVSWVKLMEMPYFEMTVTMQMRFGNERDITINGQRLIGKESLIEVDPCETPACVNDRLKNKRLATYAYVIAIQSDDANDYAYHALKTNNKIKFSVLNNTWIVDTSGFLAMDSKHSAAF